MSSTGELADDGARATLAQRLALLRRVTPERTMVVVAFVIVFAIAAGRRLDPDVWWHLRAGALTLHHGVIHHDTFSFTRAGAAWIDHSWGAEVVGYLIWRAFGYGGLALVTGLLAVAGTWFVYRMSAGGTYLRILATILAAITAAVFWSPRPQMVSYVLSAAVLYVLFLRRREHVDRLWVLPLVMLVWANLHGGFAIGLLLLAATIVGEALENLAPLDDRGHLDRGAVRKLLIVAAASVAAVCVNPYGPRLLTVPFETAGGGFGTLIEEWKPPNFHEPSFWPFAAMLVLLLLAIGVSRSRLGWTDWILCAGATLLALDAGRNVAIFAVVVTPVLTYHLAAALDDRGWQVRPLRRVPAHLALVNVALVVLVVGFAATRAFASFDTARLQAAERHVQPVGAVSFLRAHGVQGRLFNQYDWGGYLIHSLPQVPVFVDGRSDLYGAAFLRDEYLDVASGAPGWSQTLDRYRIGTVLVRKTGGLATVLAADRAWRLVYEDGLAAVFERKPAAR